MVRSPPGVRPLTNFIGQEPEYEDEKFVAAPVKKGTALKCSEDKWLSKGATKRQINTKYGVTLGEN